MTGVTPLSGTLRRRPPPQLPAPRTSLSVAARSRRFVVSYTRGLPLRMGEFSRSIAFMPMAAHSRVKDGVAWRIGTEGDAA